jgi:hypothetical protein
MLTPIHEILKFYNIEVELKADTTSVDDVAKQLAPLSGTETLFGPLMKAAFAFWKRAGVKSEGKQAVTFAASYEKVVASLAMALQREQYVIRQCLDTETGCYIEVTLPKDMFSLGGIVTFDVSPLTPQSIQVKAAFVIPGQMQAWGKGRDTINTVFAAIPDYLRRVKSFSKLPNE